MIASFRKSQVCETLYVLTTASLAWCTDLNFGSLMTVSSILCVLALALDSRCRSKMRGLLVSRGHLHIGRPARLGAVEFFTMAFGLACDEGVLVSINVRSKQRRLLVV